MTVWKFKNGEQIPLAFLRYLPIDKKVKVYEKAIATKQGRYPSLNNEEIVKRVIEIFENDKDFLDEWGSPS
jgi:hypothetical protein